MTGEWTFASASDELFSRVRKGESQLGCVRTRLSLAHASLSPASHHSLLSRSVGWHAWQFFVACLPVAGKSRLCIADAACCFALSRVTHPGAYFMLRPTRERRLQREQVRLPCHACPLLAPLTSAPLLLQASQAAGKQRVVVRPAQAC